MVMMAAKLLMPSINISGMQIIRKMNLIWLLAHERFLNLSENIGISATSIQDKRRMNQIMIKMLNFSDTM